MGTNTDKLTRKRDNMPRATRRRLASHLEESTSTPLHLVLQQPGRVQQLSWSSTDTPLPTPAPTIFNDKDLANQYTCSTDLHEQSQSLLV